MGQGGRSYSPHKPRIYDKTMDLDTGCLGDTSNGAGSCSNEGYIQHHVSKLDTLAGIAIKYGVEVADIKRLNGLTTDMQMFARKSLRIPLPGRHPPSDQSVYTQASCGHVKLEPQPRLGKHSYCPLNSSSGGLTADSSDGRNVDKKKVSSAMGLLRGYYGLAASRADAEGTEMEVYKADNGYQSEDEPFTPRKDVSISRSMSTYQFQVPANGSSEEPNVSSFNSMVSLARDFVVGEVEEVKERAVRRRPKGESPAEDSNGKQEWFRDRLPYANKNSIPRPKSSKVGLEVEVDCPTVRALVFNPSRYSGSDASVFGNGSGNKGLGGTLLGGKVVEELIFKLKKSPSTPNLQDEKPQQASIHRNGSKGDLAILSQGPNQSVTIPLLESFTRRSKAALD